MKKISLGLLIYSIIYLMLIVINWIKLFNPQPLSGVNDGSQGVGKSIVSSIFGICSLIAIIGGAWSFFIFKSSSFNKSIKIQLGFIILMFCIFLAIGIAISS